MLGEQVTMIAASDRLAHHSIIFEMNVEGYRRRDAFGRKSRSAPLLEGKETADRDCRCQRQSTRDTNS
jgi:hypothetical protein